MDSLLISISATGGHGYKNSVRHYFDSSSEVARAAVEPGHKDDLAKIVSESHFLPQAMSGRCADIYSCLQLAARSYNELCGP